MYIVGSRLRDLITIKDRTDKGMKNNHVTHNPAVLGARENEQIFIFLNLPVHVTYLIFERLAF